MEVSFTIPFTRIFPLSKYATARGKQYVWAKEPIIYRDKSPFLVNAEDKARES